MATVRDGNKTVLLVVDVQNGVMSDAWDAPRVVKNVARAVERARAQAVPVIWVQHSSEELPHGSPQWKWVPELVPAKDEALIHKRFNSSFEDTALEDELARTRPRISRSRVRRPTGAFARRLTARWIEATMSR
jgi:nicotinamidase-related amidase